MRIRGAAALLMLAAGCAHIEAPPGGPEDKQGPVLLTFRPDSMARLESFAMRCRSKSRPRIRSSASSMASGAVSKTLSIRLATSSSSPMAMRR